MGAGVMRVQRKGGGVWKGDPYGGQGHCCHPGASPLTVKEHLLVESSAGSYLEPQAVYSIACQLLKSI